MKTDNIRNCPKKRQNGNNNTLTTAGAAATTATTTAMDNLAVIKAVTQALNQYIAMKEDTSQ